MTARTPLVADARRAARCSRGSACASAPHHGGQPPRRAGRRVRRVSRARMPTAASSSPTRSRAARPRCCGRRAASTGTRRGACPTSASTDLQAKLGAIADFIYGSPSRDAVDGRRHRHERQDVVHALDRAVPRRVRPPRGDPRHARQRPRRRARRRRRTRRRTPRCCTRLLAQFRDAGARAVAMEVSSHGLDQGRVNGVEFDVALFTNLTRDHLDYHGTMAAYGAAKAQLFAWPGLARARRSTPTIRSARA